ncbi:MAG: resolvase [Pseudanabaena sp.]|nr:resolvase [Pseudanabaena sp. M110S1SP2A07QC]MCA6531719.1 resolvase [Pseudanabaena sp. M125S2SP2A07QC]MCA6534970.1 resolvase [Pseudanabaena sp. M176S2SP2A07QC]MCA6540230.1 resolvase [Pseudanabaena sp. M037S2SP2A07QC]MCA6545394.1 resolvase [Pseudanabaena sp. M074S1SP2A07QC]MCA6549024.1 resolvase [Pseudanabaena sp. M152S2SP2A07QC]MCA6554655.1 resolvase [Pseudanabaena sp. M135S2SP2A07QC]MCA6556025.1 resolvase [Pseudanabaena sp. M114S2SP2A07QC]MCA6565171.1 resolvase [Pseudanabaena sp. M151S2S
MSLPFSLTELKSDHTYELMDVEAIQKALGRSRASVYRYANTDPLQGLLNLPYDPTRLNPELRQSDREPLLFHPTEVSRFARDVLKMKQVTIQVQEPAQNETNRLLREILQEMRSLNQAISSLRNPQS